MAGNFRKRLETVEREIAEINKPEPQGKCNCREFTPAASLEYFAAEMNQVCPAHGFRCLGKIQLFHVRIVGENGNEDKFAELKEMVAEYRRRLARYRLQLLEEAGDKKGRKK